MEINQQPTSEIPSQGEGGVAQQVGCNSEEADAARSSPQQARLYECNFCKKGFSNAQALGGHMNIHRKDKAKLKRASKENQRLPASNIPLTPSSSAGNIASRVADSPGYSNHEIVGANSESWQEEFISGQGSFGGELDLELRLGHEPRPKSSVAVGTRKFF